jgi:signal peptidase I
MQLPGVQSRGTAGGRAVVGVLRILIGAVILALLINTWLVEGLLVSVIVSSGSMAPALLGPHRQWRCAGCGREFVCGLESLPARWASAVCPNCRMENDVERGIDRPGDRVLIDRSAFLWRSPRRWEPVALRCPGEPATLCVKRIAGLPGETIEIQEGDLVVDGEIAKKSSAEQRGMTVSVYDVSDNNSRWQPNSSDHWQLTDGRFVHPGQPERPRNMNKRPRPPRPIDWLMYHHKRVASGEKTSAVAVTDESPYDQNESREVADVTDLALRCVLRADGAGAVLSQVNSRADEFTLRIDVALGEGELLHNGASVALIAAGYYPFRNFAEIELMVTDHRAQATLDGRLLVAHDYQPADSTAPPKNRLAVAGNVPATIGVQIAEVEIRELEVLRDVYYTPGPNSVVQSKVHLGPDEYFVLGDNSSHAVDSRLWSAGAGVRRAKLVGRVLTW